MGFPIRKSPDQSSFAAPRGLSQLIASFIVFQRQGIHRTPLVACLLELKMILRPLCIGATGASLLPTPKYTHGANLWFRKNYRLQDIQLSKTRTAALPPQSKLLSTCASHSLRSWLRRTAFAFCSLARQPKLRAKRATSEGWWRIPGSNR